LLAHFIRYLFYDVYTKYAGEEFMKQYGPRMFHFIGSTGYSPTTGTEVLGTAAGGVKITLYNVNEIKPWSETVDYTPSDVEVLNERIFHTMHHEFSHILHQTKSYPITYGQVTSGSYDPIDWQERDSVTTHQLGYVTHYASSANYEDFVETLSGIITDTDARWMNRIINACSPGLRQGDKERVYDLIDSLEVDIDNTEAHWNNFTLYSEKVYNQETGAYDESDRLVLDVHRSEEEVVNKESTAYVKKYSYTEYKKFTSFQEFMDWVPYKTDEGLAGMNAILKKIDIATEWYTNKWGLYVFELRREVRERQNNIDDYLHSDQVVIHNIE
jgi:substrate import-associated zinc metallohydrolase lipoprotein